MRYILTLAVFALVSACARAPIAPQPLPQVPAVSHVRGQIIGLTSQELVQRFGTPALQIREGNSLKLQFRDERCVLDAYLYPPPGAAAPYRVTYVDARTPALAELAPAACIAALEGA